MTPRVAIAICAAVGLLTCSNAFAQSVTQAEVMRAQGEMLNRVSDAAGNYADGVGLDNTVVTYCLTKMHLEIGNHPTDGSIPYGVNYNEIRDAQRLHSVLSVREAFETNYLRLCLAEVRITLDAAARR